MTDSATHQDFARAHDGLWYRAHTEPRPTWVHGNGLSKLTHVYGVWMLFTRDTVTDAWFIQTGSAAVSLTLRLVGELGLSA